MNIIVRDLKKHYKVKKREVGLKKIKQLLKPEYSTIDAVKGIDLQINEGEMVGFIGPNGAGKSTTIKMLTGILAPSSGDIFVGGLNPAKDRKKLSYNIGTVFGQKSQLWFHLPPIDTFKLFSKIYEVDNFEFKKQLSLLVDILQLEPFMHKPARQLSLGQRMKCEIAASLLHNPKLIFLDEPTIGLDVVAKRQIRTALTEMNKRENTTVILTSHDAGDIEAICERVVIINEGSLILDNPIKSLSGYLQNNKLLKFKTAHDISKLKMTAGIEIVSIENETVNLKVPDNNDFLSKIIVNLINDYEIEDISITEPSLEEVIHSIYTEKSLRGSV
ncbi:ABC transporter ATP-binding protein [Kurthia sibirica]|uniref:ABC transporter n=1 Tax=Kurthia sibirica TaxID=202750 RepID=A0A2U3ALD1_9BACL|nr:ATP-binding cassette domain-containing protein [Kurthia sibirica]PWI25355.1 ABC transporter [Kurthia sibirica]GEK35466.1 ABC transporter ATP-binding protein [Kurthia sibirica]